MRSIVGLLGAMLLERSEAIAIAAAQAIEAMPETAHPLFDIGRRRGGAVSRHARSGGAVSRHARSGGARAHRRWRQRRAAGRAK